MQGRVAAADLAPLEGLRRLRSLTLNANLLAEEGGEACLAGFPEPLLKLRGLTSLAISSRGAHTGSVCVCRGCRRRRRQHWRAQFGELWRLPLGPQASPTFRRASLG